MTPHRDTKGGSLVIDRRFRGVGRIKRASGTDNPAVFRKLSRMLTALADEGRVDLLRSIRDGDLTLMEVHDAYQRKALEQLPTGDTAKPLVATMRAWLPDYSCSDKHRESMGTSINYFEREAPRATVADLPRVLDALRGTLGKAHPRSFNLARSAALTFARDTLKRNSPLWLAVAAVEPMGAKAVKARAKRRRKPLTVQEMRDLFPKRESDPIDAIAWTMATTGMHQKELWGRWSVQADRIHVSGTKREGRERDVPLVLSPVVPRMHRRTFEDAIRERTAAITPYDLRRTYARWLQDAKIPRTRRRLYYGHGAVDISDLYEEYEVAEYIAADGAALRTLLGLDGGPVLRLEGTHS